MPFGIIIGAIKAIGGLLVKHWAASAALAASVGMGIQAGKEKRKLRERIRDASAIELSGRSTNSGAIIPVAYGRTAVRAIRVFTDLADGFGGPPLTNFESVTGTLGAVGGRNNEFLLAQYDLCVGPIERVLDVWTNDVSLRDSRYSNLNLVEFLQDDRSSGMAAGFSAQRDTTATFDDLAYLTAVFMHDRDDPQFFGPPELLAFIQGRKVRDITSSGFSDDETYSGNWARCLADWLTHPLYGPYNFTDADIDIDSFTDAVEKSGVVIAGDQADAEIDTTTQTEFVGETITDYSDLLRELGYFVDGANVTDYLVSAAAPAPGETGAPTRQLRYEVAMAVATSLDFDIQLDIFKECAPGAQVFQALNGKWKAKVPDLSQNLDALSVMTIDETLLVGSPSATTSNENRRNQKTVRFANINNDFAEESITWPTPGGALDTRLLAEDGGVRLADEEALEGINNPLQATSIAANQVLASRRLDYSWVMKPLGFLLEPGDIVLLQDPVTGISEYVMVLEWQISENFMITCAGVGLGSNGTVKMTDYQVILSEKQVLDSFDLERQGFDAPTALTIARDALSVVISWTRGANEPVTLANYEVQVAEDGTNFDEGWLVPADTSATTYLTTTNDALPNFAVQVRGVTTSGRKSEWLTGSAALDGIVVGGRGIDDITRDAATGVVTVEYTDGTSDTFTVQDGTGGVRITSIERLPFQLTWYDDATDIPGSPVRMWAANRVFGLGFDGTWQAPINVPVGFPREDFPTDGNASSEEYTVALSTIGTGSGEDTSVSFTDEYDARLLPDNSWPVDLDPDGGPAIKGTQRLPAGDTIIRVTYSDGTTTTFPVRSGNGIKNISRDATTGLVTITYDDDTTNTFVIMDGQAGGLSEWIYRATATNTAPNAPATTATQKTTEDFVPAGWNDNPVDGTYVWVSSRSRASGAASFSDFSAPVLFRGLPGRGIATLTRDAATGVVTATYSDGAQDTFTVSSGVNGSDGTDGIGVTSMVRNAETGVVTITYSDNTMATFTVPSGEDGNGIKDISRNSTTGLVTITYDDDTTATFTIMDGAPGGTSEWIYISTDDETDPAAVPTTPVATDSTPHDDG